MSHTARNEQRAALVNEWRQSGLSQQAFCQLRQLNLHSLQYWRKLLAKAEVSASSKPLSENKPCFVSLVAAEPVATEIRVARKPPSVIRSANNLILSPLKSK